MPPYPVVLDGYDREQRLVVQRESGSGRAGVREIAGLFEDASVRYVLVRDGEAGCFDFRVERRWRERMAERRLSPGCVGRWVTWMRCGERYCMLWSLPRRTLRGGATVLMATRWRLDLRGFPQSGFRYGTSLVRSIVC